MKKICLPLLGLFLLGPLVGQEGEPVNPPSAAEETADTESISQETVSTDSRPGPRRPDPPAGGAGELRRPA